MWTRANRASAVKCVLDLKCISGARYGSAKLWCYLGSQTFAQDCTQCGCTKDMHGFVEMSDKHVGKIVQPSVYRVQLL